MIELEEEVSKQGSLITALKSENQKVLSNCCPFCVAYMFGVHMSQVTKILHWIDIMSRDLQQLISWPDHELV